MLNPTLLTLRLNPLLFALFLALSGFGSAHADVNGDGKTVLCFVSHKTSHGFGKHEYAAGCHLIGDWLTEKFPDEKVEARYSINWPENEAEFFKDADTVVFFCSGGGGHLVNNHVAAFDKVMRTGAGIACLHYAVEVPIGPSGKGMLNWMGGYFETNWSVNPHWDAEFTTFSKHPAARGVKPFKSNDEWYFHMRFVGDMKGVTPILSAVAPAETMKRKDGAHSGNPAVRKAVAAKEPQHLAWAYERGDDYNKGRGFGFTGLHYHANWREDSFRKTVLNGVAWTAGLEIPKNGIETAKPSQKELDANALKYGGEQGQKKKTTKKTAAKPKIKPLYQSPVIAHSNPPSHSVDIDVALPAGSKELVLVISDGGDGVSHDWAAWADPALIFADGSKKNLTDFDWKSSRSGYGKLQKNANIRGAPIQVLGKVIENGIGAHANSVIVYDLPKGVKRFTARGVLDDGGTVRAGMEKTPTSVRFEVFNQASGEVTSDEYVKKSNAAGREASEAVDSLEVHPDLEAQLFASEPMITSPSSIDIDARGRVWVCDIVNYRRNQGKRPDGDRILILEDTDGDAKADKSTVFYQGHDVDSAHGICVLGERVIISCGDEIFSLYDRDGDGKADPKSKEVLFSNIGGKQHDHGIHAVHFGPDGRLYFNFGNAGRQLCDPEGNLITDINGIKCTNQNNRPYQEGMVFRCDPDGKNVEMIAWNFRNNWEVAVDSFGTIWQSDNDDDGNKAVRINYVMEYGNYGYKDEITGAGWRDPRPGMSEEIPLRHFHQNDPGVVPNLLQTGAGSPTGLCIYEGELLPEVFRGQMIHCDAGPNVVRSYPVKPYGAGYQAEVVDILKSTKDRWFRPSDVCVAPDGSLFVADWYDPGVGGHGMGDIEKGRIFRVIPKGNKLAKKYQAPPTVTVGTTSKFKHQPFTLLSSPNESSRYDAWQAFAKAGSEAESWLTESSAGAFNSGNSPGIKARALWLLARLENGHEYLEKAMSNDDADLRITALRATRQLHPGDVLSAIEKLGSDRDPRVRRECAIALRFVSGNSADKLWAKLAKQYDDKDRWYLEALGIGADLHWDDRLAAFEGELPPNLIWRSRGKNSAQEIANLLVEDPTSDPGLVRAIHFQSNPQSQTAAYTELFMNGRSELALFAGGKLGPKVIAEISNGPARLESLLKPIRGKAEFVRLAERLNLSGFDQELADYITKNPNTGEAVTAAKLLLQNRGTLSKLLRDGGKIPQASAIVQALGKTGDRSVGGILSAELKRKETPPSLKAAIVNAMAMNGRSGRDLLNLTKAGQLGDSLKSIAALAIARSPDAGLRNEGAKILPVPKAAGAENFPPMAKLVGMKGDAKKGATCFTQATCNTCHKIKGEGVDFGPDLSEIGNKLSRQGMFEAILYPSAAISQGFHGVTVTKNDGSLLTGYLTGETDSEWQLRLPGGVDLSVPKKEIAKHEELKPSLMPPGLAAVIGADGLVDLVTYLQTLK